MTDTLRARRGTAALVLAAGALGVVAERFAAREAWGRSLVASLLGALVAGWVVVRVWRGVPRPPWKSRLTRAGALYLLGIFVVAGAALASGNNLMFLVLAAMLAALLASGLFSRLNLAELELQCALAEQAFAGQQTPVRLLLKNLKSWTPSFSLRLRVDLFGETRLPEVYFPMIAGGRSCSAVVELCFPRRGRYRQDTFWLESRFPFGFFQKRVRLELPREVLVYPSVEASTELDARLATLCGQAERPVAGLGQDFYRLRPYQSGDSSRVVHWKASAHAGELKVREFSVEEDRRVEILFDRSIPRGQEWRRRFEAAVGLCAALAWRLHRQGAGVRFGASDLGEDRLENVYDILSYLALVEAVENGPPLMIEPSGLSQGIFTASAATARPSPSESSYCFLEDL